jgi:hypothetical protein
MKTILIAIALDLLMPFYSLSNPAFTSVPFQLTRNLVIVEASVNGKNGLFIMDTGVSEIILNNRYFDGKSTGDRFYGISGSEMEKKVNFIRINLGGYEKQGLAIITDFSALERTSGLEILGVIGNSIFKNCELVLDYTFKELTIYRLDKKGNRLASKNIHQIPLDTLTFTLGNGVPFIEVLAHGKRYKMSVDSGASANVMDIREMDRNDSTTLRVAKQSLASFGPKEVSVKSQITENLIVGKLLCPPMKTLYVNMDHFNKSQSGINVSGILGYEFLNNFRVAINFKKNEIYLWNRETVELQLSMTSKMKSINDGIK